jgi:hypothetical protein
MKRTAWLVSLCWRLPEEDPVRLRLQGVLLARLDVGGVGRAANDVMAPRHLTLVSGGHLAMRLRPAG